MKKFLYDESVKNMSLFHWQKAKMGGANLALRPFFLKRDIRRW